MIDSQHAERLRKEEEEKFKREMYSSEKQAERENLIKEEEEKLEQMENDAVTFDVTSQEQENTTDNRRKKMALVYIVIAILFFGGIFGYNYYVYLNKQDNKQNTTQQKEKTQNITQTEKEKTFNFNDNTNTFSFVPNTNTNTSENLNSNSNVNIDLSLKNNTNSNSFSNSNSFNLEDKKTEEQRIEELLGSSVENYGKEKDEEKQHEEKQLNKQTQKNEKHVTENKSVDSVVRSESNQVSLSFFPLSFKKEEKNIIEKLQKETETDRLKQEENNLKNEEEELKKLLDNTNTEDFEKLLKNNTDNIESFSPNDLIPAVLIGDTISLQEKARFMLMDDYKQFKKGTIFIANVKGHKRDRIFFEITKAYTNGKLVDFKADVVDNNITLGIKGKKKSLEKFGFLKKVANTAVKLANNYILSRTRGTIIIPSDIMSQAEQIFEEDNKTFVQVTGGTQVFLVPSF
ncbi:MAG: hypothetical protein N2505_00440 [Endomicrobia bacterium]|nr:hypothetical protein [Endomicrobiia bacterium]